MIHFAVEQLLQDEAAYEAASKIHQAYVDGGANSWENPTHPNHFQITSIQKDAKEKYAVTLHRNDQNYSTEPMFGHELISILCGGKFKVKAHGVDVIFNTKEASFQFRITMVPDLLKQSGIEYNAEEIQNKIISGILNDNSKGLLATHWIHALDNTYGLSDVDLMHILWCMYINYDSKASVLKDVFPLTDIPTIEKDVSVLNMCQDILGLPSRSAETQNYIHMGNNIRSFLTNLQHLFIESIKETHGEEMPHEIEFLSEQRIYEAAEYFQARHQKLINPDTIIDTQPLCELKAIFEADLERAANLPSMSHSFRK